MKRTTIICFILMMTLGACNDSEFDLGANVAFFPNPFLLNLNIELELQQDNNVEINLYNAIAKAQITGNNGNDIQNPVFEGFLTANENHRIQVETSELDAGIYFVDVIVGDKVKRFEIYKVSN
ncbi:MAG: T9SS type A sorting domain-containing protein [Bacteroidota bacterium]